MLGYLIIQRGGGGRWKGRQRFVSLLRLCYKSVKRIDEIGFGMYIMSVDRGEKMYPLLTDQNIRRRNSK